MKLALLLASFAAGLHGQSFEVPSYYLGFGGSAAYYGTSAFSGETDFAVRLGSSNAFSFSSIDLPARKSASPTARTGVGLVLKITGSWILIGYGTAGVQTGTANILGSVGAGLLLGYSLGTFRGARIYATIGERIVNVTTQSVIPAFTAGLGMGF